MHVRTIGSCYDGIVDNVLESESVRLDPTDRRQVPEKLGL